jgi:hypothetical protein
MYKNNRFTFVSDSGLKITWQAIVKGGKHRKRPRIKPLAAVDKDTELFFYMASNR